MHVEGLDECFLLLGLHWNAAAYEIAYSTIAIRVVHYYSSTFFTGVFLSLVLSQVVYLKVRCALDVLKNCARMGCLCVSKKAYLTILTIKMALLEVWRSTDYALLVVGIRMVVTVVFECSYCFGP